MTARYDFAYSMSACASLRFIRAPLVHWTMRQRQQGGLLQLSSYGRRISRLRSIMNATARLLINSREIGLYRNATIYHVNFT